jgi:hypothetical protein
MTTFLLRCLGPLESTIQVRKLASTDAFYALDAQNNDTDGYSTGSSSENLEEIEI